MVSVASRVCEASGSVQTERARPLKLTNTLRVQELESGGLRETPGWITGEYTTPVPQHAWATWVVCGFLFLHREVPAAGYGVGTDGAEARTRCMHESAESWTKG